MRLLLVNGNTTQAVTDAICAEAMRVCGPDTQIEGATATFGAEIVTTHAGDAIAAHAVLDVLAERAGAYDAAILGISFDSGLAAARELSPAPVVGMTEAALLAACGLAERFPMVVFGASAVPLYESLLRAYAMTHRVSAVRCIDLPPASYLDGHGRDALIMAELAEMPQSAGAPVVICGAALAGTAARLQLRTPLRLIDGIAAAIPLAEQRAQEAKPPRPGRSIPVSGLSPALTKLFAGRA
jgi:allantoin racemase